jgi:hypothetical protein
MAAKTEKTEKDPGEVLHLQVKPGGTAHYQGKAFGDRATLQVRRGDRDQVDGDVEEVDPRRLPDVGERPSVPPPESRKP